MLKVNARRRVRLSGAQETLLITLYAKALDHRSRRSVLHDAAADRLVGCIDYDFTRLPFTAGNRVVVPLRARQLDEWLLQWLAGHPEAVVLNLGCGLDTRVERISRPSGVSWFDLDHPEVIDLRRNFFTDDDGYRMVPDSLTAPGWLADVPADRPLAVVAEGVLEYLSESEVAQLLDRLTAHAPHGEVMFDVMNSAVVRAGRAKLRETTGAVHRWTVDDVADIDRLCGRLSRREVLPVVESAYVAELPWRYRVLCRGMARNPSSRTMMQLLRYEF